MRGCDSIIDDPVYMGTSKSVEGYLAGVLFKKAKDEGCNIAVNWQDQDSSSEKAFHSVFTMETSARVMKCGGHIGRSHGHALKEVKSKSLVMTIYKRKNRANFPEVDNVSCCCKGKRHSPVCGCLTDLFIESAKSNLFCAISQCGNNGNFLKNGCATLGSTMQEGFLNGKGESASFIRFVFAPVGNVLTGKRLYAPENSMPLLTTSNVAYTLWHMR